MELFGVVAHDAHGPDPVTRHPISGRATGLGLRSSHAPTKRSALVLDRYPLQEDAGLDEHPAEMSLRGPSPVVAGGASMRQYSPAQSRL
jgi:hypothetical protein